MARFRDNALNTVMTCGKDTTMYEGRGAYNALADIMELSEEINGFIAIVKEAQEQPK